MTRPTAVALVAAIALSRLAATAQAQIPEPRLIGVYPASAAPGTTVDVQLVGSGLEGIDALHFDGEGLRAFHGKGPSFKVAVAPGTPPGRYDVRASGPLGLSNPRIFVVDDRPQRPEAEPNNRHDQATRLEPGTVAIGRLEAVADVDAYTFDGRAGATVTLRLDAASIESRLVGVLRLDGPDGRELAAARPDFLADPTLVARLPADGRYVVAVSDLVYGGSTEHQYRLALDGSPVVEAVVPSAMKPGEPASLRLLGRNLGPSATPDGPAESLAIDVQSPGDDPIEDRRLSPVPPLAFGRRGVLAGPFDPEGRAGRRFLLAADLPVRIEAEPNDEAHPQEVALPAAIGGRFDPAGDVDVFRFRAKKGDVWWVEAWAERIGSAADPTLVVQRVVEGSSPQEIGAGDDLADPAQPSRFPMATVDAAVRVAIPEDGLYQVVLSDLYGPGRGDPRLVYHLEIRPERPGFAAVLTPDDPAQPGGLTLRAGGRLAASVQVRRRDGFDGPILVEPAGLPAGVTADPVVIGPGQSQSPIVFTAAEGLAPIIGPVSLIAGPLRGDRKELLDYRPGPHALLSEDPQPVAAGGLVWPAMNGQPPGRARLQRGAWLAVREGAPFELTATPAIVVAGPGEAVEITVKVARRPGFTESVALSTSDLPPNLAAANATIAKEADAATLKLTVAPNVPPGTYTILVRGTGAFPFQTNPAAADKPAVNATGPTNPIRLTVRR